jgi:hypothetical protein
MTLNEVVVAYLKLLSQLSSVKTEETQENP